MFSALFAWAGAAGIIFADSRICNKKQRLIYGGQANSHTAVSSSGSVGTPAGGKAGAGKGVMPTSARSNVIFCNYCNVRQDKSQRNGKGGEKMHPPSSKDNGEIVEATGLSEIAICIKRKLLF